MKFLACLLILGLLACPALTALARGGSGSHGSTGHTPKAGASAKSEKCADCKRDSKGNMARCAKAKDDFKKANPCPSTGKASGPCPGYVLDHVKPLKRGGADAPSNMQWQTTAGGKAKDKVE